LLSRKPKEEGICDICKTAIAQRNDDNEETAKLRFETYENETAPLLGYFEEKGILNKVDANKSMKEVWEQIKEIIA
jgi:adenylate kinase